MKKRLSSDNEIQRTCEQCGRVIPSVIDGNLCEKCLDKKQFYGDKYYDTRDMSIKLGISEEQVRRRARQGKMTPRVPHIRRYLWPKPIADKWLSDYKRVSDSRAKYAQEMCRRGDHSWMKDELYADSYKQDEGLHYTCRTCSFCSHQESILIIL